MQSLLRSPPSVPVYLCAKVGLQGASHHSACPVLRHSESGPLGLSVCECGTAGSASGQTACPVPPTLLQCWSRQGYASPLHPGPPPSIPVSAPPTSLDECFLFIYLVSDFLAVRFSVGSGCARRLSVSTYASILLLCQIVLNFNVSDYILFAPFLVLILFQLKMRSYGICPSLRGLFHLR